MTTSDDKPALESYAVHLRPGIDSIDTIMPRFHLICSGLRRKKEQVILEEHPDYDDPTVLRLRIVEHSPVVDTVAFTGPQWFEDGYDAWIEPGMYADGDGRVTIPIFTQNSTRSLLIFGAMGSGKSALLNSLGVSALSSGRVVIWYLDGQNGASSPQLSRYADWAPVGPHAAMEMLEALEAFQAQRQKLLRAYRWPGINPTPELPALLVFVDEFHKVWLPTEPRVVRRWDHAAREGRKLGCGIIGADQHPELPSLGGSDPLRQSLGGTRTIMLRTPSAVAANIARIKTDPSQLPDKPGYGYLIAPPGAARSAMWRADHLGDDAKPGETSDADAWFEHVLQAAPTIDQATARHLPDAYTERVERAEAERARLLADLNGEELPADDIGEAAEEPQRGITVPAGPPVLSGALPKPKPQQGLASVPDALTDRQASVWAEVAAGRATVAEIRDDLECSDSTVYEALKALRTAGHVQKASHGRYELPSS